MAAPPMTSDIKLALRSLWKNPGFAAVALLTIALGVGANTAVFSVVNALLIQPLPYPDSERLVAIYETAARATIERRTVSYPNFRDWEQDVRGADAMSLVMDGRFTMLVGDSPERVYGELVSSRYFDVLGVTPALGRPFTAADDVRGAAAAIVISDQLWTRAFNRDPGALGRAVRVEGRLCTIAGIMPPGFRGFSAAAHVWGTYPVFADAGAVDNRGSRRIDRVVARLSADTSAAQFEAELRRIAERLAEIHEVNRNRGVAVVPIREEYFGNLRTMLVVLLGAVGFVLLIACVNVANLLLARGAGRRQEVAVRGALGAGRPRLVRQLLTESLVLSVLGGAAGLLAASWSIDLLVALSPIQFPSFVRIGVDPRVLAFAFAVCVLSGLLFGAAPALAVSKTDLLTALRTGGRTGAESGPTLLQRGLVTAEIALALVLLAGAGLMLRTLNGISTIDPGFRPAGLVTLRVALPSDPGAGPEADAASSGQFARNLLARLQALPAIADVSLATDMPLGPSTSAIVVTVEGRDEDPLRVYRHAVSPGHFRTLGVPLLEGRDFTPADGRDAAEPIVIVSRTMARRHWPGERALHKRLRHRDRVHEVVGVVGDVKHRALVESASADPDVYYPFFQLPSGSFFVLMRSSGDARPAVSAARGIVHELDPAAPVFSIETGEELVARQTSTARFGSVLLGAFAIVALTLTIVGIYGVTSCTVSRQTREVGIRVALGATRGEVLRLVLTGAAVFIAAGLGAGTVAALGLTRLLSSLIYGVSPTDPATFAAVGALLALVALLACLIPAMRATRIDPAVALRNE